MFKSRQSKLREQEQQQRERQHERQRAEGAHAQQRLQHESAVSHARTVQTQLAEPGIADRVQSLSSFRAHEPATSEQLRALRDVTTPARTAERHEAPSLPLTEEARKRAVARQAQHFRDTGARISYREALDLELAADPAFAQRVRHECTHGVPQRHEVVDGPRDIVFREN